MWSVLPCVFVAVEGDGVVGAAAAHVRHVHQQRALGLGPKHGSMAENGEEERTKKKETEEEQEEMKKMCL